MKLFPLLFLSVLLAYPAMAQEPQTQPSDAASATETNSEARSLYAAGVAAYENERFEEAASCFRQAADMEYAPAQYMLSECYRRGRGVKGNEAQARDLRQKALKPLQDAADKDDAEALYLLGKYAESIYSFPASGIIRPEARFWVFYRKAADLGYAPAQYALGDCSYSEVFGAPVKKDLDEALKWYRKAAEAGYAPAQHVLGMCYETGDGVTKDSVESLKWYRKAAEAGYARAIYRTGVYYAEGKVVEKDEIEAGKWYKKAAELGYSLAQFVYGRCCDRGEYGVEKNEAEAFHWYKKAAEQSLPAACSALAECYVNGRGTECDIGEARKWNRHNLGDYTRRELQIGKRVMRHLDPGELEDFDNGLNARILEDSSDVTTIRTDIADSYYYGRNGFKQNYAEAAKWYRISADMQREGYGFYELGFCYEFGKGVEADLEEAEKWYDNPHNSYKKYSWLIENRTNIRRMVRRAQAGDAETAYQLGLAFFSGIGVKQDTPESAKWFRAAAEQNHPGALYRLGRCYAEGLGVEKDMKEAVECYFKAAEHGNAEAQFELGKCCETGTGVPQDDAEAIERYRQAAEQGLAEAQCALANLYLKSEEAGGTANEFNALLWFFRAAEHGNAEAQYQTGKYYGSGKDYSRERRRDWLTLSAEQNYAPALYELARSARGTYPDPEISRDRAAEYLIRAAYLNYAPAQMYLAECYRDRDNIVKQDEGEAAKWYLRAEKNGAELDSYAMYFVGQCHAAGKGVKQDKAEAVKWYRRAVEHEKKDRPAYLAASALGDCYYLGDGVKQDKAEAEKWYRKAADDGGSGAYNYKSHVMLAICYRESGDERFEEQAAKAMKNLLAAEHYVTDREAYRLALATCYEKGIGVGKSDSESFRYCTLAADRYVGASTAFMRMARCYRLGIGVEKSREKEEEWLLKAAMKDSPEAQVMLGDFYAERKDDPVSCANALRWYQAGAEHGYAPAVRKLATCYSTGSLGVRRDTDLAMEFSREKAGIVQPVRDALREFGFAD